MNQLPHPMINPYLVHSNQINKCVLISDDDDGLDIEKEKGRDLLFQVLTKKTSPNKSCKQLAQLCFFWKFQNDERTEPLLQQTKVSTAHNK